MKFVAEIEITVADHDADIMQRFPAAVKDRFAGTAIKIDSVKVTKTE